MKKLSALLFGVLLLFSLAACGQSGAGSDNRSDNSENQTTDNTVVNSEADTENESTESTDTADAGSETTESSDTNTDGKILVVYYSASGNTGKAAEYVAQAAGADTFEIVPVNEYTSADLNWTDNNSRVVKEHDDPELRSMELVADTVENWDEYDTVFIGFPIWWGIAAWPTDAFVEANDFSGKTVIPFCTSSSSGLGESGELLAEKAGSGEWLEGMRFRSGASEEDVSAWVESLGLD